MKTVREVGGKGRGIGLRLSLLLAVLVATALLNGACGPGQKPVIKLDGATFDSKRANNAIAEFIIEKGYGYPVEMVDMTSQMMEEALPKGEIDLRMEAWQQNRIDWYNEHIENGDIVNLGMIFEAGPQSLIIPKWVADEYNIRTVFDMADHWELFRDPLDSNKGVFFNGTTGWGATDINEVKLEAYGLDSYYNGVIAPSSDALEAVLERDQERHEPVFGYYWAPASLMGAYDWHILEEPPYSEEVWANIIAAVKDEGLRPVDGACAYEDIPVDKLAHSGLQEKAPDVVEMLQKMVVGLEPLNKVLGWVKENNVEDWEEAAIYYLQSYEDRWETWVTDEAYERIKQALGGDHS